MRKKRVPFRLRSASSEDRTTPAATNNSRRGGREQQMIGNFASRRRFIEIDDHLFNRCSVSISSTSAASNRATSHSFSVPHRSSTSASLQPRPRERRLAKRVEKYATVLRKRKPGQKTYRHLDLAYYLKPPKPCISKQGFMRFVREICKNSQFSQANPGVKDKLFQESAIEALREASETFLVDLFNDSLLCTVHAKRKTVMVSDIRLVNCLRQRNAPIPN